MKTKKEIGRIGRCVHSFARCEIFGLLNISFRPYEILYAFVCVAFIGARRPYRVKEKTETKIISRRGEKGVKV